MNKKVALITFFVFLLFLAAGGAAILALGTSTGVVLGGATSAKAAASVDVPYQTQAGWIRNNSPWPVTITSVDLDDIGTSAAPTIYLSESIDEEPPVAGEPLAWAVTPASFPYEMAGGSIVFLGYGIVPEAGKIASFDTITVNFEGPLPYGFSTEYSGVALGVSAPDLPAELLAADPTEDATSIDNYVTVLRTALASGDLAQLQRAMGDGTTEEQATALRDTQAGFNPAMPVVSSVAPNNSRSWTLRFYTTDAAVDGLPAIDVNWEQFRWTATVAG